MSLPATEYWFSTSVRRNRKSFIFATLLLVTIPVIVLAVIWFFQPRQANAKLLMLIFSVPVFVCSYFLAAQRLRDFNVTGWLALLYIPIGMIEGKLGAALSIAAFIILCTVPGTVGDNRYGPDPLQNDY